MSTSGDWEALSMLVDNALNKEYNLGTAVAQYIDNALDSNSYQTAKNRAFDAKKAMWKKFYELRGNDIDV